MNVNNVNNQYLPSVTVILPVYNGENTLTQCIECILASDYPNDRLDIIVIDDGSNDNSYWLAQKYELKSPFSYKVIRQKNKGPALAKNVGFKLAKGDIIFLISADVNISNNYIKLVSAQFKDPLVGISQGPLLMIPKKIETPIYHCTIQPKPSSHFVAAAIAYRAKSMDEAGRYFDENFSYYGDDTDLAMRILKKGYRYTWVSDAIAHHDIVPRPLTSLTKSFFASGTKKLVMLIKSHPELRNNLLIKKVFWPGYYKGRLLAMALFYFLPIFYFFGSWCATLFGLGWLAAISLYVYLGQYNGLACTKKVYVLIPILVILQIINLYLSSIKFIFYSLKFRTLVL
jgi:glycosyltransferase involved in cell wall biosynthesis